MIGGHNHAKTKIVQTVRLINRGTDQMISLTEVHKEGAEIMRVVAVIITEIVLKAIELLYHRMIEALKGRVIQHMSDPMTRDLIELIEVLNEPMIEVLRDRAIEALIDLIMTEDLRDKTIVMAIEIRVITIEIIQDSIVRTTTALMENALKSEDIQIQIQSIKTEVKETSMSAELIRDANLALMTDEGTTHNTIALHHHLKSRLKNSPGRGVNCN